MKVTAAFSKIVLICVATLLILVAQANAQATSIPAAQQIKTEDLVKLLQASGKEKPIVLHIGPHMLYAQAHIAGAEYVGPASTEAGLGKLRKRVESLPRAHFIVLYCGCCPWSYCPNVQPANAALRAMGFTHVSVLYIGDHFGTDWVDKGYPTAKGD